MGVQLFGVSYAPLFLIFAVRSWPHRLGVAIWSALFILFLVDALWLLAGTQARNAHSITVEGVKDQGSAVSGYLASYLLPFVAAPPINLREALAYAIFLGVALIVFVKSDLVLVNPALYVLGWRVVEISHSNKSVLLICRWPPRRGDQVRVVDWLNAYIEKKASHSSR